MARSWTGKGSIANWIIYGLFILVIIIVGVFSAGSQSPPIIMMVIPTALLSMMLLSVISAIYSDRQLGLFYLIRTQGLLKGAYLLGTSMYSLTVMFMYGLVALSLLYAMPLFRDPTICPQDEFYSGACTHKNGDPPIVYPLPISWWEDEFNGEPVQLFAAPTTGSYGRVFGAAAFFALTMPGAVLASSYVPGYKFALVLVVFIALFVSILPLSFFLRGSGQDEEGLAQCVLNICSPDDLSSFSIDNLRSNGQEFLNCVGFDVNYDSVGSLCLPPVAAILPQFGLFQTLAMTIISDIILISDPPEYVEQVLIPSFGGDVKCSGGTCVFPYTKWVYGVNLGYMAVGAIILLFVGIILVSFFSFPGGVVLRITNSVSLMFGHLCCGKGRRRESSDDQKLDEAANERPPLKEVVDESKDVESLVKPILKAPAPEEVEEGKEDLVIADHDMIPRDDLPPVLMYKLRKVYPSLGGLPPKVALASLDLHVPKGQVLGLLGKNGAGKTVCCVLSSFSVKECRAKLTKRSIPFFYRLL
jgi:ABC-type multidrug transport system fused ATPase/permease subunit